MTLEASAARALATARGRSFWLAGGLALLLSSLSWTNPWLVRGLNRLLSQHASLEPAGWWVYLAVRLPLTAWLLWVIVRSPQQSPQQFPRQGQQETQQGARAGDLALMQGGAATGRRRMFDPLMGLRALACVMVLMGHFFMTVFSFEPTAGTRLFAGLLHANPWAGVWIFFTLSGYLMGKAFTRGRYALNEEGSRGFLRNRLLRIVPIYYGAILLVGLLRSPSVFEWRNGWILIEMLIFDYRADLPISVIGALWSISTEVQFYLLVPFLMVVMLSLRRHLGRAFPLFVLLLLAAGTGLRWFYHRHLDVGTFGYLPLFGNLDIFVTGMSINLLPRWGGLPAGLQKRRGPLLLLAAVVIYSSLSLFYAERRLFNMETLKDFMVLGPWVAVLCAAGFIYFAEAAGPLQMRPGPSGWFLRAVQWIGTLTYCLYVFHSSIFESMATVLPKVKTLWDSLAYFPEIIVQTFAVAAFFYYLVERPFDRKKKVGGSAVLDAP